MSIFSFTPLTADRASVSKINSILEDIEANFARVVYRDEATSNSLQTNLDFNGNSIVNLGVISGDALTTKTYVDAEIAAGDAAERSYADATFATQTYVDSTFVTQSYVDAEIDAGDAAERSYADATFATISYVNSNFFPQDADDLSYDNTGTTLVATNVGAALDELAPASFTDVSSSTTLTDGIRARILTSNSGINLTFPSVSNAVIEFADAESNADVNTFTLTPSGSDTILGETSPITFRTKNGGARMRRVGTNWEMIN